MLHVRGSQPPHQRKFLVSNGFTQRGKTFLKQRLYSSLTQMHENDMLQAFQPLKELALSKQVKEMKIEIDQNGFVFWSLDFQFKILLVSVIITNIRGTWCKKSSQVSQLACSFFDLVSHATSASVYVPNIRSGCLQCGKAKTLFIVVCSQSPYLLFAKLRSEIKYIKSREHYFLKQNPSSKSFTCCTKHVLRR